MTDTAVLVAAAAAFVFFVAKATAVLLREIEERSRRAIAALRMEKRMVESLLGQRRELEEIIAKAESNGIEIRFGIPRIVDTVPDSPFTKARKK